MKHILLIAVLLFSVAAFAQSPQAWDAKTIVWQDLDHDGTKWAVLEGDKDATDKAFTYAFFIPAGYSEHHWHSQDARVAVILSELKVSFGDKPYKAGGETAILSEASFTYLPTFNIPWELMSIRSSWEPRLDPGRPIATTKITSTDDDQVRGGG